MRCLDERFSIATYVRGCILDDNPHNVYESLGRTKDLGCKKSRKKKD
jgi:hypothetical protein